MNWRKFIPTAPPSISFAPPSLPPISFSFLNFSNSSSSIFKPMEYGKRSSANSSNGSPNSAGEKQGTPATPGSPRGDQDSVSSEDSGHSDTDEENEGSPGDDLEDAACSVESDSASSKSSSNSDSESHSHSHINPAVQWRRGFVRLLKKRPPTKFQNLPPLKNMPKLTRRKSRRVKDYVVPSIYAAFNTEDLCYFKPTWKNYSLADLEAATDDFSRKNLIGQGGYAEVYRGVLADGQIVAIKRLTRGSPEEMTMDFLSELGIIVHVDHPNIAKLIGYGVEGGMHLVLQLSPHGSLHSLLYGEKEKLSWAIRYKIALGSAEGLYYLHEGCQRRIIHKDIKSANILLSEDFDAQISDFGLAKWLPDQWSHHTVEKIEGTFGYLPPEFFMHGIVDEKTDVYAYGVLLLELITGRQAVDDSQLSLVMWAKPFISNNKLKELVDPMLGDAYDLEQLNYLAWTASYCISQAAVHRPQMKQVVKMVKGDECSFELMKEQQNATVQLTYSEDPEEEYNSSEYLSDMRRHMETILGSSNNDDL